MHTYTVQLTELERMTLRRLAEEEAIIREKLRLRTGSPSETSIIDMWEIASKLEKAVRTR